nr:probable mediator of RNA polymerase II transcription subunit 26C [Ipomoea batatas]GMC89261.1 probable mediator of RNA polymerase II transcription subunit 26C [Ipomoea batatas]GMD76346.1 probable mediator of RNA polymerase II transcription subunit 26C [Ipomoea batatas]GMD78677.1 probable mediator of RNA polymerase II transcription subunit 26C [Ipomoea batatas]
MEREEGEDKEEEEVDPYGGLLDDEQRKIVTIKEQIEDPEQMFVSTSLGIKSSGQRSIFCSVQQQVRRSSRCKPTDGETENPSSKTSLQGYGRTSSIYSWAKLYR